MPCLMGYNGCLAMGLEGWGLGWMATRDGGSEEERRGLFGARSHKKVLS